MERLWWGLQLPQGQKKRKRINHKDSAIIRLRLTLPNCVWAIGLVHDKLSNGWSCKMPTGLDEFTRQASAVTVFTSSEQATCSRHSIRCSCVMADQSRSDQKTGQSSRQMHCRTGTGAMTSSRSSSYRHSLERTNTLNGSTEHNVEPF